MQAHDDDVAEIVVTAMDEAASMDVEEMTREVVRRVEQRPIAWTEFKKVLIMLRDGNVEHDAAMFGVTVPLLQEVLRRLAQPTTWNAHYRRCKTHEPRDMQYWQRNLVDAYNRGDVVTGSIGTIPRFGRERIILVSSQYGNIMDPAVRAFWVHRARQGIHSFVAGPPCETWSQARENDLGGGDDDYKGPRVLRTAARSWGLEAMSLKEIKQVIFEDTLLGFVNDDGCPPCMRELCVHLEDCASSGLSSIGRF